MSRGRTVISFEGLNINRTLNLLSQKFAIENVVRQGKNCQITVQSKDVKQAVAFLQEKCYTITNIQKIGASFLAAFFRKHFLLPVFLVVVIALMAVSSGFCWKIEVSGDFPTEQVTQALSQCDVKVGSSLFGFNADVVENRLATGLDAMYAVVNRKGSALYVNVVKKKQIEPPIDMKTRRDIVATCSGTVTELLCEQGTPLVKVGDVVKKGDVLLSGIRVFNDGTQQDVYALGQVTVQPSVSAFAEFTGTITETVETGNVFTATAVVLFGKSYGALPQFEQYRVERTQSKLFPLNLTIEKVTYYEVTDVQRPVTLEESIAALKAEALQQALLQADFQTVFTEYDVSESGVTATVYGEVHIS